MCAYKPVVTLNEIFPDREIWVEINQKFRFFGKNREIGENREILKVF